MRHLVMGLLFMLGIAAPQIAWADSPTSERSSSGAADVTASDRLRALFRSLDLH